MATYFITESYLKSQTPITANVDVTDVTPFIKTQSEMRVQPILGTYFYDIILAKYNAQTLTANEEILVSKIQPLIAWRSAEDAVFNLTYQLKNKGLQKQDGDNSTSVSPDEMAFGMKMYSQKAAFYEQRLFKYLEDNRDLFADFTSKSNTDSDIKPLDTGGGGYLENIMII